MLTFLKSIRNFQSETSEEAIGFRQLSIIKKTVNFHIGLHH